MDEKEIIKFLKLNIEPISDTYSKKAYPCSAYLRDGTYLPCVIFRNKSDVVELALKRLGEAQRGEHQESADYKGILESFIVHKNTVVFYAVEKVEKSRFALPSKFYNKIWAGGETSMSWLSFVAKMDDGKEFLFGSQFNIEFFEMPEGYSSERIIEIYPHKTPEGKCFREKPFFDCFVANL